jgi:SNF2 family DNA or RNA helicase
LDVVSPVFSLFSFAELRDLLQRLDGCRFVLPDLSEKEISLCGDSADRHFRNRLNARWLARTAAEWLNKRTEIRNVPSVVPQSLLVVQQKEGQDQSAITGSCSFSTSGLGITPGQQFGLIQASGTSEEAHTLAEWFLHLWNSLPADKAAKLQLLRKLEETATQRSPANIYQLILHQVFKDLDSQLDEERVVKSATGIRDAVVWKKLYRFQRDGVVGAIDKLERLGGCIIADSVGLGKTFEALAIVKYYELRNDRVLVLCPKRLRDNWTLYKANDRRNILAPDRLHYDVLNHTDLSRSEGRSGDIDLSHVNWGNYDLVVIDESHNFRNKLTHQGRESRYDRLMRQIIREGVKTRVLMLSATPVNNRLSDLKNQIAFVTEGDDRALQTQGIDNIDATVRQAQLQFNRWMRLDETDRNPARLLEMLGFDYFKLLDLLTIARSRKHIEKYYGISETGKFPERLRPLNIQADVDKAGQFASIREINNEIRRLNLSAYAPLRYVLPSKQAEYDEKYSTQIRGGTSFFRQVDREESLIHLLRVNILKRMESSVVSFTLTLQRQLQDVDNLLTRIDSQAESLEEISIEDVEVDDPTFESLLIGRKVKVLIRDVDRIRWRQDLQEDRDRLASLLSAAQQVGSPRDAKLAALRDLLTDKIANPINDGNRKVLIFTAFADTAEYLYRELAGWAFNALGLHTAVVTGTGSNKTNFPKLKSNFSSILTAFAPRAKERPVELANEGEIDILIATDCISEGQNLQDCDYLVNYDIHWNPVRIIQRFGRIDRLGSPNQRIQLVNFWPNIELEEYINLEQRVSSRMVLLDISATGEENLIEPQADNEMNDLEYRRKQLLQLKESVLDLEDLPGGISITDLTLNDFRADLSRYLREHPGALDTLPLGTYAVTANRDLSVPPGIVFCLRAEGTVATAIAESGYPLAPHYLVYVGDDGAVALNYIQVKQILDTLRRLALDKESPDTEAYARFDRATREGRDMEHAQELLAKAVASIAGNKEERALASLFTPGGTHIQKGEFAGINDFEVVAFLVVLPEQAP